MYPKHSLAEKLSLVLFLALQIILFPKIQESTADVWSYTAFFSIALIALFALLACRCKGAGHLIRLGLLLTLVADYFIVIEYDSYLKGVVVFLFVQITYFLYLLFREERVRVRVANFLTRLLLSGLLFLVALTVLGENADALSLVSVIYYANLLTNILFAFTCGRGERMLAIGLALFAMCDLCVGIESLAYFYLDTDISAFFYNDSLNLSWLFYQPSQVLIALSLYFNKGRTKDRN